MIRRLQAAPLRGATACGALYVFGFAPFDAHLPALLPAWPLTVLALAGLYLACADAGPRAAAMRGLAFGTAAFLGGVSWVYVSLAQFSGMPPPAAAAATLAFCLYLALFPALACAAAAKWRRGGGADIATFAAAWMLTEWLRGTLFTGFPWLAAGYAQTPPSPLAGYAPVFGVHGVGLLVTVLAAALARLALARGRAPRLWLTLFAVLAGGLLLRGMAWTVPAGEPLKVALLQGNVAQDEKWDPLRLSVSVERYADLAKQSPAALTVLPETAIPLFFDQIPREVLAALTRHGDVILGAAASLSDGGYTNAAVAVTPKFDTQAYAKRHLVPFGEYPPPGFAWFFRWARIPMSDFTAGRAGQAPLTVGGQRIAPNICYEDLFGEELARRFSGGAATAPTLMANLSNIAWFGPTIAIDQHLHISRLRTLEFQVPMVRATNTGATAAITHEARVAAMLPPHTRGTLPATVQGRSGVTPYVWWVGRTGLWPLALLGVAVLGWAALAGPRHRAASGEASA